MASDIGSSRFLFITLLVSVGVLAYYYWDASSAASAMMADVERLTRHWGSANTTIGELKLELEGCKAKIQVVEDEKNKLKATSDEKDKKIEEKTKAETKATEGIKKLTDEKAALDKQVTESKALLDACTKECEAKVTKAKEDCAKPATV